MNSPVQKQYFQVLTIAGSDSSGGAGIQADLKTISALGCYGLTVITALTAQNSIGVKSIYGVHPDFIRDQLDAVLEDIRPDAVKIGMLHAPEVIMTVANRLKAFQVRNIVLDPVMVAKSGDRLLKQEGIEALKTELFPIADVITPNLPEASALLNKEIQFREQMEGAAIKLLAFGPKAVVIKGGHLSDLSSPDCLVTQQGEHTKCFWLEGDRVTTRNTHGTGCTFSSAIAANLATGIPLYEALQKAKEYLTGALQEGTAYRMGRGHGPVHHFFRFWR